MRHLMGLVLAGGLLLGTASNSDAQFGLSIGNPYAGQGLYAGVPSYGYGYPGYTGYGFGSYGSVYNNSYGSGYLAGPGTFAYSSGYRGYAAPVNPYGYGYGYRGRPYYGGYGGGYGFRPLRGVGRMFR